MGGVFIRRYASGMPGADERNEERVASVVKLGHLGFRVGIPESL